MEYSDFLQFYPDAKPVKDGRTINAILRKAAKLLGIDWRGARLCVSSPWHYVDYDNDKVHFMELGDALRKIEHNGKKGFDLVFVSGCFCPYLVSLN